MLLVDGPSGPVLLTVSRGDGWLVAYDVSDGSASVLDSWQIDEAYLQLESTDLVVLPRAGYDHLLLAGLKGSDLTAIQLTGGGPGSFLGTPVTHDASGFDLGTLSELSVLTTSSGTDYGFAGLRTGGLALLDFGAGTNATALTVSTGSALDDARATSVETIQSGSRLFGFAAFGTEDAISAFRINTNGTISHLSDSTASDQGIALSRPQVLKPVQVDDKLFLIVAASDGDALSVFDVAPNGDMTRTDVILDSLDTRFANVANMEVVEIDGRVFVVASGADRGLSMFALTPGGKLHLVDSIAASVDLPLNGVTDLAVKVIGGDLYIWASTEASPFLMTYTATGFDIGITELASASGGTLTGTNADDILEGQDGNDSLNGRNGDDVLIDGGGADTLTGGSGADVFMLIADGVTDRITDFQVGVDKLDLTGMLGLWNPDEVIVTSQSWGARVTYRGEVTDVYSSTGTWLSYSDIVLNGLHVSGRLSPTAADGTIIGSTSSDTFIGSNAAESYLGLTGNDSLQGGGGDDTLNGGVGSDTLSGGTGEDVINGGDGDDVINGDAGFDTIEGGDGRDTIDGGAQADSIRGGDGDDRLIGGVGYDNIYGEGGNDTIFGGDTADRLYGGDGNDEIHGGINFGITVDGLFGGAGNDTLYGDGGFDFLDGGTGDDSLNGGLQADNLYGGAGRDTLEGEDGLDRLFGGDGDDLAYGGTGDDGLFGEAGNDLLDGGDGNDRFFGGTGNDTLLGGAGNDEIHGGAGYDTITGGTGNDTITGDFNADIFIFADGYGQDQINDFDALNDFEKIDLSGVSAITGLSDLISDHLSQVGSDAVIDTGGGDRITLINVDISDLDANDFLF